MKNAIIFVLGCSVAPASTPQLPPEETLCIHLYNLAGVRTQTVQWATQLAGKVFARAGISTRWELHSADSPESTSVDLNTSVVALSRSGTRPYLVVRVVQEPPSGAYPGALGFAIPLARFGTNAEIFYRRIEFQAASVGTDPYIMLAYALAHEIGHVLLRSSSHSRVGIMQAYAGAETWRLAKFGSVAFLPEQATQMRQQVRRYSSLARVAATTGTASSNPATATLVSRLTNTVTAKLQHNAIKPAFKP